MSPEVNGISSLGALLPGSWVWLDGQRRRNVLFQYCGPLFAG